MNAVINVVDAVCVDLLGERSASSAHEEALDVLGRAEGLASAPRKALAGHLAGLLSVKNLAQYEGRLLEEREARDALRHMARAFQAARPFAEDRGWPRAP